MMDRVGLTTDGFFLDKPSRLWVHGIDPLAVLGAGVRVAPIEVSVVVQDVAGEDIGSSRAESQGLIRGVDWLLAAEARGDNGQ